MHLEERRLGETVVVDVHGPVDREHGDLPALLSHVRALANHGCTDIVLNVEALTHADSVVVGTLAHAYISTNRAGARLRLQNVRADLRKLLAITRLDRVLGIVDDDEPGKA
jgi:anti-anti-sigma factor